MSGREQYAPGAASGAEVRKDGEKWTLVLVRDLRPEPRYRGHREALDRGSADAVGVRDPREAGGRAEGASGSPARSSACR
jgi:hypothetical protein